MISLQQQSATSVALQQWRSMTSDAFSDQRPIRVTFLTIMPSPYIQDLFAAIADDGRILPRVFYMEMAAPETHWGEASLPSYATILSGGWRMIGGGRVHWNPGAIQAIRDSSPDIVVVAGYSSVTAQFVMRWLQWHKMPWIFWGEVSGMRPLTGWKSRLRALARYPATAWPDAIAAIGTFAAKEYAKAAHAGCKISSIPYYTDLKPFLDLPRRPPDATLRLMYCGQLIERKGLDCLFDAFLPLATEFPQLSLTLVGDGPLGDSLSSQIPPRLQSQVRFTGFQPVTKLPAHFAQADLFVLPSRHDGWGVVVNQALGAGLPIICTKAVGATHDLVTDGWNGFVVPADDATALADSIRRFVFDADLRTRFSTNSRSRALEWTPDRGADRWARLARSVLDRRCGHVLATHPADVLTS